MTDLDEKVLKILSGALSEVLRLLKIYFPADTMQPKTIKYEPQKDQELELLNYYLNHRREIDEHVKAMMRRSELDDTARMIGEMEHLTYRTVKILGFRLYKVLVPQVIWDSMIENCKTCFNNELFAPTSPRYMGVPCELNKDNDRLQYVIEGNIKIDEVE